MGIRKSIKSRIRGVVDKFSGEYSSEAPEEVVPLRRNVSADPEVEILRPRYVLQREERKAPVRQQHCFLSVFFSHNRNLSSERRLR